MHKFKYRIQAGIDNYGDPTLGFDVETKGMFIHDPTTDETEMEPVDPLEYYGIPPEDIAELERLRKLVHDAVQDGINAACLTVQDAIGQTDGGVAGLYWTGRESDRFTAQMFEYVALEFLFNERD